MRVTALVALILAGSVGCALVARRSSADWLDPGIPAADAAPYSAIQDGTEWRNPILTIQHDGIRVESDGLSAGYVIVPASDLMRVLLALPISAWPYGRVVAAADASIVPAEQGADQTIRASRERTAAILRALEIAVEWWPA